MLKPGQRWVVDRLTFGRVDVCDLWYADEGWSGSRLD